MVKFTSATVVALTTSVALFSVGGGVSALQLRGANKGTKSTKKLAKAARATAKRVGSPSESFVNLNLGKDDDSSASASATASSMKALDGAISALRLSYQNSKKAEAALDVLLHIPFPSEMFENDHIDQLAEFTSFSLSNSDDQETMAMGKTAIDVLTSLPISRLQERPSAVNALVKTLIHPNSDEADAALAVLRNIPTEKFGHFHDEIGRKLHIVFLYETLAHGADKWFRQQAQDAVLKEKAEAGGLIPDAKAFRGSEPRVLKSLLEIFRRFPSGALHGEARIANKLIEVILYGWFSDVPELEKLAMETIAWQSLKMWRDEMPKEEQDEARAACDSPDADEPPTDRRMKEIMRMTIAIADATEESSSSTQA